MDAKLFSNVVLNDGDAVNGMPRIRTRWLDGLPPRRWSTYVISMWDLRAAEFADMHQHDEVNHVLEGQLLVGVGDITVEANVGDTVVVPGGVAGTYTAPVYARMFTFYGPNPDGSAAQQLSYREL